MKHQCCAVTIKGVRCKLIGVHHVSDDLWICRSHFETSTRRCVNVADDYGEYNRAHARFLEGTKPNDDEVMK